MMLNPAAKLNTELTKVMIEMLVAENSPIFPCHSRYFVEHCGHCDLFPKANASCSGIAFVRFGNQSKLGNDFVSGIEQP
jgi:hypothetical protein